MKPKTTIKYLLTTMGISKELISKFAIGNWFHAKLHIVSPTTCMQCLQVKSCKVKQEKTNKLKT